MRSDELYKFSDGTLTRLLSSLEDITRNIDMEYLLKRRLSNLEKKRAHFMIKDINKLQKERRMMRSLEKFVGGRLYGTDLKLLYSNPMIQPEPDGSTQGYPLDSVEVLRYDTKGEKVRIGNNADLDGANTGTNPTRDYMHFYQISHSELVDIEKNIRVISFTMKMEILLEPTSNKLMVDPHGFEGYVKMEVKNVLASKSGYVAVSFKVNAVKEMNNKKEQGEEVLSDEVVDEGNIVPDGIYEDDQGSRPKKQRKKSKKLDIQEVEENEEYKKYEDKSLQKKKRKGKKADLVENEMVESESNEEPPLRKKKLDHHFKIQLNLKTRFL
ncbi:hypothetical protein Tco_0616316 [Tanacetum coccineum]